MPVVAAGKLIFVAPCRPQAPFTNAKAVGLFRTNSFCWASDSFTVADLTGLVAVDIMKPAKLALPDALGNLRRWHAAVAARPSASA